VSIYEIQVGVESVRSHDPFKASEIELWLAELIQFTRIVAFDAAAARETARMMHGKSLDLLEDAMIAAIAAVNGLTIATRDTADFLHFGVAQVDRFLFPRA
jgi:predicted nucleic acid-binding protein